MTAVLGVIAIAIGILKPGSIFTIILFAFGGLGIWAAPIVVGMYWKRTSRAGVWISVIAGEIFYIAMLTNFKWIACGFNPLIVAFIFTVAVLVLVSLVTKPASNATLARHFD